MTPLLTPLIMCSYHGLPILSLLCHVDPSLLCNRNELEAIKSLSYKRKWFSVTKHSPASSVILRQGELNLYHSGKPDWYCDLQLMFKKRNALHQGQRLFSDHFLEVETSPIASEKRRNHISENFQLVLFYIPIPFTNKCLLLRGFLRLGKDVFPV